MSSRPDPDRRCEVLVVGGGLSGLVAAWRLQNRDVLVLEAAERIGGRIRSEVRGDRWVNLGAHLISPGQVIHRLADDLLIPLVVPSGLGGMTVAWGSRLIRTRRPEMLPFRLPLSIPERASLVRAGIALKLAHRRATRADDCGLLGAHVDPPVMPAASGLDPITMERLTGRMHRRPRELVRIAANRAAAEPSEISAHYVAMSSMSSGEAPRFNAVGGTERLVAALADTVGRQRVRTLSRVVRVAQTHDGVVADVDGPEGPSRVRAQACIVAVPAPIVREVVDGLPPEKDEALAGIQYGSYVVAGFFTNEQDPLPWADRYTVLAPDRSFCLLFNSSNARPRASAPSTGGSFIVYAGGHRARDLLSRSDPEIAAAYLDDLRPIAPEIDRVVEEVVIQRWPLGNAITTPGRVHTQRRLTASFGRVSFVGDYLGHPGMDSAAAIALHVADAVRARLAPAGGPSMGASFGATGVDAIGHQAGEVPIT
jgi:oxygen-dependent protoporphyrinogen oxidase